MSEIEHQETEAADSVARDLDVSSLKALAHPMRVQILDSLTRYGAQTASSLGELLGESSGSTSYHLRQLEKHDFVRCIEGKGTARERWWERSPGRLSFGGREQYRNPETAEAVRIINREFISNRAAYLEDYLSRGDEVLTDEWIDAGALSTITVQMTAEQLADFNQKIDDYAQRLVNEIKGRGELPEQRAVQVHIDAFPILDSRLDKDQPDTASKE
ncbi:helix-turn-helix domain-containing protein [Psychromicrobium sp. YIM B11713]|uniref:helix-turn-helix domain-containing protein n=1 Tax=Psychromicrobium sp. YIM B11713 TaxID=3145233 RepID=UPI00374F3F12